MINILIRPIYNRNNKRYEHSDALEEGQNLWGKWARFLGFWFHKKYPPPLSGDLGPCYSGGLNLKMAPFSNKKNQIHFPFFMLFFFVRWG